LKEYPIYAKARTPFLSREVSKDYAYHQSMWDLIDLHESHGGSPKIVGVVIIDVTVNSIKVPRYKLEFSDGFIDYARVDNFDEWYEMKSEFKVKS
jgi:hypothetical protein